MKTTPEEGGEREKLPRGMTVDAEVATVWGQWAEQRCMGCWGVQDGSELWAGLEVDTLWHCWWELEAFLVAMLLLGAPDWGQGRGE